MAIDPEEEQAQPIMRTPEISASTANGDTPVSLPVRRRSAQTLMI